MDTKMRKFNAFMVGFASVFSGIGSSLILFCDAIGRCTSFSGNSPTAKINYFDGFQKDRQAISSDWRKIGIDFRQAINTYVETHEGKTVANF